MIKYPIKLGIFLIESYPNFYNFKFENKYSISQYLLL